MAHFYGTLVGQAGKATRRGSKSSGLITEAASWNGVVTVTLDHRHGQDHYTVEIGQWQNNGPHSRKS
jgi:hypothetical protein